MPRQTCPNCGANYKRNLNCQSVFNEFLALELTDPDYGAVHLLTVACYMIQHSQYTDEALVWIEKRLRDYLEKGISIEYMRQQAAIETGQDNRNWRVTRRAGDPQQTKIPWSRTIVDVALQYHDSASYRDLEKQSASTSLNKMQLLLTKPAD